MSPSSSLRIDFARDGGVGVGIGGILLGVGGTDVGAGVGVGATHATSTISTSASVQT